MKPYSETSTETVQQVARQIEHVMRTKNYEDIFRLIHDKSKFDVQHEVIWTKEMLRSEIRCGFDVTGVHVDDALQILMEAGVIFMQVGNPIAGVPNSYG